MEDYGFGKEAEEGTKRRGQTKFDRTNSEKRELEETFNKINKMDFFFWTNLINLLFEFFFFPII